MRLLALDLLMDGDVQKAGSDAALFLGLLSIGLWRPLGPSLKENSRETPGAWCWAQTLRHADQAAQGLIASAQGMEGRGALAAPGEGGMHTAPLQGGAWAAPPAAAPGDGRRGIGLGGSLQWCGP